MTRLRPAILLLILALGATASPAPQDHPIPIRPNDPQDVKLPNGKSQKDEIIRADHDKNVEDAQKIIDLGMELKKSLEKNTRFVLAIEDLKKLEELEKLTKRMRSRMRRF